MKVYVFGNKDLKEDKITFDVAEKLKGKIKDLEFVEVKPNEDLPFAGEENVIVLDTVEGVKKITLIDESNLDKIQLTKSVTAHDYDLGFQLVYLKKLGKLRKFTIIGLPQKEKGHYLRIQSILRKLVAQDMQGS
jgi:Ni,Fe-hydrogenase maturation factor